MKNQSYSYCVVCFYDGLPRSRFRYGERCQYDRIGPVDRVGICDKNRQKTAIAFVESIVEYVNKHYRDIVL